MKKETWQRIIALVLCCVFLSFPIMAAEPTVTIEPYTRDEFPDWLHDLRRAEIVSLGSLPFVTLGVTLSYSLYRYFSHDMNPDYFPNPFAKSSSAARLTTDEQLGILFTSLGISAAVGVIDFTISTIQRHKKNKEEQQLNQGAVKIIPLEDQETEALQVEPMEKVPSKEVLPQELSEEILADDISLVPLKEFPPFGLLVSMPERSFWSVP